MCNKHIHVIPDNWKGQVNSRTALLSLRHHVRHQRWDSPLFDTARWISDWERGLKMLWDAHVSQAEGPGHVRLVSGLMHHVLSDSHTSCECL